MSLGEFLYYAVIAFAVLYMAYQIWIFFSNKRLGQQVDNETFKDLIRQGQLVDLRTPDLFRRSHILGARNFPVEQFASSLKSLRKDKPILLYEDRGSLLTIRAMRLLKKAGYSDFYVLKNGFESWNGKVKSSQ